MLTLTFSEALSYEDIRHTRAHLREPHLWSAGPMRAPAEMSDLRPSSAAGTLSATPDAREFHTLTRNASDSFRKAFHGVSKLMSGLASWEYRRGAR